MKSFHFMVLLGLIAAFSFMGLGCGGEDDPATDTGVTDTNSDTPQDQDAEGYDLIFDIPESDTAEDTSTTDIAGDAALQGACTNESDLAIISDTTKDVQGQAKACGMKMECFISSDFQTCVTNCLSTATGLSQACAGCYAGISTCAKDKCLSECMDQTNPDPCNACLATQGCITTFDTCSGLPPQ